MGWAQPTPGGGGVKALCGKIATPLDIVVRQFVL